MRVLRVGPFAHENRSRIEGVDPAAITDTDRFAMFEALLKWWVDFKFRFVDFGIYRTNRSLFLDLEIALAKPDVCDTPIANRDYESMFLIP